MLLLSKTGTSLSFRWVTLEIIDLPGSCTVCIPGGWMSGSVIKYCCNQDEEIKADVIVAVADASNLKRNLLFEMQPIDLKIPVVVVLTMLDIGHKREWY